MIPATVEILKGTSSASTKNGYTLTVPTITAMVQSKRLPLYPKEAPIVLCMQHTDKPVFHPFLFC